MDGLIVLLVLIALAIPVAIIVLLVGQNSLRHRVGALERLFHEQRRQLQGQPEPEAPSAVAEVIPAVEAATLAAPELVVENKAASEAGAARFEPQAEAAADTVAARVSTPWDKARRDATVAQAGAVVIAPERASALANWLKLNWVYVVSAISLALAGVFFVQYGIETGVLTPLHRVLAAMVFGLCLIGAGEWMRRRHGDGEASSTAYLPSVFAGAGLVSIFAAVLAARQMYGLIEAPTAFAGHLLTAALAVGLGWFYGPLLVAIGLIGAATAPFIVSGGSGGNWLYGYFGLIAGIGLMVDTLRRWAWVSVLALILGYAGGWLVMQGGTGLPGWMALLIGLAVLAIVIPERGLIPRQDGPCLALAAYHGDKSGLPPFPARLAAGAAVASAGGLTLLAGAPAAEAMLALGALSVLALAYLLWADRADGLADLGLVPALGLLISLLMQGLGPFALVQVFQAAAVRPPETAAPMTVTIVLGMAAAVSGGFALRSFRAGGLQLVHGLAAALVAPVAAAILELLWHPGVVMGDYPWALHVIALAAAMVALALRYAGGDVDRRRAAYATLSALSLIALALFLLTTKTALTLALAVLALVAAGLDRRFRLPEMGWFIQVAVAVLGYRLLADPGLDWAMAAPLGQVILAFAGVIAALLAALWVLAPLDRVLPKGVLESAAAGLGAILANIVIVRWLMPSDSPTDVETHWSAGLNAMPWLVLMLMQIYRARLGGALRRLRQAIALIAAVLAVGALALALGPFNPLFSWYPGDKSGLVRGPMLLDSLLLAYAVPGLTLTLAAWKLPGVSRWLRWGFLGIGCGLLALYAGLEIRRFWQGDWLGAPGVVQGELYSYTVALMLLGAGLLYQAIAKRSRRLRQIAMVVIGLVIAKVFLLDAAGLTGLTRVASFLGLGLSLAGLAWLNRWAGQVSAVSEK